MFPRTFVSPFLSGCVLYARSMHVALASLISPMYDVFFFCYNSFLFPPLFLLNAPIGPAAFHGATMFYVLYFGICAFAALMQPFNVRAANPMIAHAFVDRLTNTHTHIHIYTNFPIVYRHARTHARTDLFTSADGGRSGVLRRVGKLQLVHFAFAHRHKHKHSSTIGGTN